MYMNVDLQRFITEMREHRYHSWTDGGLTTLYEHLISCEDDNTVGSQLDVITLTCGYTEYDDLDEVLAEYTDYSTLVQVQDNTCIIPVEGTLHWIVEDM